MNKLSRIITWAMVAGALLIGAARLWAEDPVQKICGPNRDQVCVAGGGNPALDAANARISWLEQKLAATEAKMAALMQFYSAQDQLTALVGREPKPPTPTQPSK